MRWQSYKIATATKSAMVTARSRLLSPIFHPVTPEFVAKSRRAIIPANINHPEQNQ